MLPAAYRFPVGLLVLTAVACATWTGLRNPAASSRGDVPAAAVLVFDGDATEGHDQELGWGLSESAVPILRPTRLDAACRTMERVPAGTLRAVHVYLRGPPQIL
jgi:hypothetical protein